MAHLQRIRSGPRGRTELMILIGELKALAPDVHQTKAVIKHLPGVPLLISQQTAEWLPRRFETELSAWHGATPVRLMIAATFSASDVDKPTVNELTLLPVSKEWLPVENSFEQQLVRRLVGERRSFHQRLLLGASRGG